MPFALIIVGVLLVVSSVRGTVSDNANGTPGLITLVKGDFTGANNFSYWLISLLILGALGYIDALKPLSRVFMVLVIVVLFLSNGGFFAKFNQQAFGSSTSSTVTNAPISLGGLPATYTGDPSYLPSLGIENPLKSARQN
jgi:hypothetical protein